MTITKCTDNNFCSALLERCKGAMMNKNADGLLKYEYMDSAGKKAGAIVAYSKGKGDKGLALNFCPFCGFSFYQLYQKGKRVGGGTLIFEKE